jgi:hypothetical protein
MQPQERPQQEHDVYYVPRRPPATRGKQDLILILLMLNLLATGYVFWVVWNLVPSNWMP